MRSPFRSPPPAGLWARDLFVALLVVISGAGVGTPLETARGEEPSGRRWAVLIGVEKYQHAPNLLYTINDVEELARTLQRQGELSERCLLKMVDTAPDRFQPSCKGIKAELPGFLAEAGAEDQVLVYFSGHGFRDGRGGLYLAPADFSRARPAETGIPVTWLREQIENCRARFKLLVIDACHAGSEKAADDYPGVSPKDLAAPFEQAAGVFTLASCSADEKSQIWTDVKQSLFSYWLNQGLKGHADSDGNSRLTTDELYQYVHRTVSDTARRRFSKPQTPVRIVGPRVPGVPVVLELKPYSLKGTLENMAEELATLVQLEGLDRVGVPEFSATALSADRIGDDFGLLGRYCAEDLARRLGRKAGGNFQVVEHEALHKTLSTEKYCPEDLQTTAVRGLTVEGQELPAVAIGRLCVRTGWVVTLRCSLVGTDRQEVLGVAGGTALLNASEQAMCGRSAAVRPAEDYQPDSGRTTEASFASHLEERFREPHPLLGKDFPFRVGILVDGKRRPGHFVNQGRDLIVPLRRDEVYQIEVENRADHAVFVRLLVDGLNTLPEKVAPKGIAVEPTDPWANHRPAQRVNLSEALAWRVPAGERRVVRGFFSRTGQDAKYHAFRVVDAPQSAAAGQQFTEQIGLITAAFYRPHRKGAARSVGTALGEEYDTKTGAYPDDVEPGRLLGVVHIRYVEPDAAAAAEPSASRGSRR